MIDIDLDLLGDLEYFNYMGVRYNEKYTFYYDETNNCRKFWIMVTRSNNFFDVTV